MVGKSVLMASLAVAAIAFGGLAAEAAGRGGGGPGGAVAPFTPPGFSSPGAHSGFETFTHTTTTTTTSTNLPGGWDEGKAGWKMNLQSPNPILTTRPPGLSR